MNCLAEAWENIFILVRGTERKERNEARKDREENGNTWRQGAQRCWGPGSGDGKEHTAQKAQRRRRRQNLGIAWQGAVRKRNLGSGLCEWNKKEMGLGRMRVRVWKCWINWTPRGRCVIESWVKGEVNQTRFGDGQKRNRDRSHEIEWDHPGPSGTKSSETW